MLDHPSLLNSQTHPAEGSSTWVEPQTALALLYLVVRISIEILLSNCGSIPTTKILINISFLLASYLCLSCKILGVRNSFGDHLAEINK